MYSRIAYIFSPAVGAVKEGITYTYKLKLKLSNKNKFKNMSVIVVSGEQISKSPLNRSVTKQMFSFPKSDRFKKEAGKR